MEGRCNKHNSQHMAWNEQWSTCNMWYVFSQCYMCVRVLNLSLAFQMPNNHRKTAFNSVSVGISWNSTCIVGSSNAIETWKFTSWNRYMSHERVAKSSEIMKSIVVIIKLPLVILINPSFYVIYTWGIFHYQWKLP